MKKGKFLIIDGSSLVYRAFFALPLLQTRQGFYTNAVYGFTTMLLKVLSDEQPDYVAVAFDKSRKTFRHDEYSAYKAKREKTPGELTEQLCHVRDVLEALGIPVVEMDGYEADDLIGTLAHRAGHEDIETVIVSGDADIFQLVDAPAEVIFTRRGITQVERYNEEELKKRYGLSARQFIDFKGLKGDSSDNIPGVPGVGEKTALKLLEQFQSLEGVYEHLAEVKGKLRETLKQHRDLAFLSKRLATIVTDVPLEFNPGTYARREPDHARLRLLFEQLEFKSLLEKLPAAPAAQTAGERAGEGYRVVSAPDDWQALEKAIKNAKTVAVLTMPADASWQDPIHGLTVAGGQETYCLPFTVEYNLAAVVQLLEHSSATAVVYDAKAWFNFSRQATGREAAGTVFDAALAAYLLDPLENGYPPHKLAQKYLDRRLPERPGKKQADDGCEQDYTCAAVRSLYDLYSLLDGKLQEAGLDKLYYQLELPLTRVLAGMEQAGIAVDPQVLAAMREELHVRVSCLEQEIYVIAGETFNLNSPKQLGAILFEKLGLPALKKTKTGYSTDAQVLEELAPHHEVVAKILQYRTLMKLLTTYLEGLSKLINPRTGRIHTTFNQTVTATGRLSSTEPNLQNIPIRLEEGRRIRRAFIPGGQSKVLLSADYSQIELRILAHISKDPVLIDAFCREEDIHRRTAAEVFGLAPEDVTRELRERAKAVNFGIIYGISDYGLSRQLGIPRQEAKTYITRYLERLPGVREYIHRVVAEAHEKGYVTTLLNRRRYLPEINSRDFNLRSFAERTAMNTPIQGSAADIIKLAMLRVDQALAAQKGRARMILQVHDDLVFEVEEETLADTANMVKKEMEGAFTLSVPLTVDVKAGGNWAEMKKLF